MPSYFWGPSTLVAGIPASEKGAPGGVAVLDGGGDVPLAELGAILALIGAPLGIASLDAGGTVPVTQLPSPLPGSRVVAAISLTTGNIGIGALAPIPGTLIPFVVGAGGGMCSFNAAGVFTGVVAALVIELYFRIDGIDVAPEQAGWFGAGGAFVTLWSLSPHLSIPLAAGPHTVELSASQFGGFALSANPGVPLNLSVEFPG